TSMPAWIIVRSTAGEALAGPIVHTIRVRRTWVIGSRVLAHAPAHLVFGFDHATLELGRIDHGTTHAAHHVALKAIGGRDRDQVAGLRRLIRDALDGVVGRMALAREQDMHAVHQLLA